MVLGNSVRKLEHIDIVLNKPVEGPLTTMLEYVFIPYTAYSEISPDDVRLETRFLGKKLSAPLIISGMTGGAPGTERINKALAEVASEYRIGLGVGSQRAAVEDPSLEYTFRAVRDVAPEIPVIANLGAAEVVRYGTDSVIKAVEMVNADALAIHLNLAQEAVQPEGTPTFKGLGRRVGELIKELSVPLIIKEVGAGLSYEVVKYFRALGVKYFDTEGAGGTNWVLVEMYRARDAGELVKEEIARSLAECGIPTAASIIEARNAAPDSVIIGSGGLRTSLDAVKALRLGADLIGMARPFLKAYFDRRLREFTEAFIHGLKVSLMLVGARDLGELRSRPLVITSLLKEWALSRGLRVPHTATH